MNDDEPLVTGDRRGLQCLAAFLAYTLGTAALAGGAPRSFLAAAALPPLAMLAVALMGVPRGAARRLLTASGLLGAAGAVLADLLGDVTYAAATQRGHLIRLLWSLLVALTLRTVVAASLPDDALRAAWRRFGERSWSSRSALAGAAISIAVGALILAWAVGDYPWGPDIGVTIPVAWDVSEGRIPYVDFYTFYHAGHCYLLAAWLALLGPLTPRTLETQVVLQHMWIASCLAAVLRLRLGLGGGPLALALAAYFFFVPALEGLYLVLEPMISCSGWAALALASLLGPRLRAASGRRPLDLLGGLLVGLLAMMALATKQSGGVFLAAIPLVHLDAGRLVRPVLAAQLVGAVVLPAAFFGAYPDALPIYWQQSVLGMFSYAGGTLTPREPAVFVVQHLARNALLPIALGGALGVCCSELRKGRRPGTWGDILLLFAGAVTVIPSAIRPYLHYYLLPMPFAVFALALLARRGAALWSAPWQLPAALGLLVFGLTPIAHYHQQTLGRDAGAAHQRAIHSFMQEHLGGRDRALILPNNPEYYVLTRTRSPDGVYRFVENRADFEQVASQQLRLAREARLPVFLVDRGGKMLEVCRQRVRELGWVKRAEGPKVEYWACD